MQERKSRNPERWFRLLTALVAALGRGIAARNGGGTPA